MMRQQLCLICQLEPPLSHSWNPIRMAASASVRTLSLTGHFWILHDVIMRLILALLDLVNPAVMPESPCEVAASTGSSQTWTYVNMKCFNMLDWHEEWNSMIFVALCWRQLPLMRMHFFKFAANEQTPIRKRPPFKLNWTDMNDRKTTKNTFKDEWIIMSGDYKNHRKFATIRR